jgi:hypothetical protein
MQKIDFAPSSGSVYKTVKLFCQSLRHATNFP